MELTVHGLKYHELIPADVDYHLSRKLARSLKYQHQWLDCFLEGGDLRLANQQ